MLRHSLRALLLFISSLGRCFEIKVVQRPGAERDPFSGLRHSAGALLHTPWREPTSMATVRLSRCINAFCGVPCAPTCAPCHDVRFIPHRPFRRLARTICTSVSLRSSIRVSPDFNLATQSSPSFGSLPQGSYSNLSVCGGSVDADYKHLHLPFTTPPGLPPANLPCSKTPWSVLQDGSFPEGRICGVFSSCCEEPCWGMLVFLSLAR